MSLRDKLIGCWKLQSYMEFPVDEATPIYPLGEDAKGILMYTHDGFMSVQIMRSDRPAFASGDWFRGTPEEYTKAGDYIAYAGPFDVDEETSMLTHGMFVSFFPNWLGQTQIRLAELQSNCLRLAPVAPIQSGGKAAIPRLVWQRAGLDSPEIR